LQRRLILLHGKGDTAVKPGNRSQKLISSLPTNDYSYKLCLSRSVAHKQFHTCISVYVVVSSELLS